MWFHVASVRSAFTGGLATAVERASDPLAKIAAFLLSSWLSFLLREKPKKVTGFGEREGGQSGSGKRGTQ
jgi:hypothetical protein